MTIASAQPTHALPDGPAQSPTLQLVNWILRPLPFLDDCAQRYGDVFTVRLNNFCPMVFCSHPDGIQSILKASPNRFFSGQVNKLLLPLVWNAFRCPCGHARDFP